MQIHRKFTLEQNDPFEGIRFVERTSKITNADGSVVSSIEGVMVPDFWSQVSVDIMAQKYFRKAGIPARLKKVAEEGVPEWLQASEPDPDALIGLSGDERFGSEQDARQVFRRLAGCWAYWGWKNKCFDSEELAKSYFDEMCYMLARQLAAPNSPQWFNTGLNWAYGIEGPSQGHYYFDPETNQLAKSRSAYERPQPHACFIMSIKDDLVGEGGIMDLWRQEARLFKYGSGTGTNFSSLRGSGEPLSGGGRSSGLMSFLKIGDRAAKRYRIRRHHATRGEDGDFGRRPPGHRRIRRMEGQGRAQGSGAGGGESGLQKASERNHESQLRYFRERGRSL